MRFIGLHLMAVTLLVTMGPVYAPAVDCQRGVLPAIAEEFPRVGPFRRDYLRDLERNPILTAADRVEIGRFFAQNDVMTAARLAEALFLQRRLERIEREIPGDRTFLELRYFLENKVTRKSVRVDWATVDTPIAGGFIPPYNFSVSVPVELRGGIAEAASVLHEGEHAIQHMRGWRLGTPDSSRESQRSGGIMGARIGYVDWELAHEAGAMLIEGEFYLAVPRRIREHLAEFYRQRMTSPEADYFLRQVDVLLTATSPSDYVRRMWAAGRYHPRASLDESPSTRIHLGQAVTP